MSMGKCKIPKAPGSYKKLIRQKRDRRKKSLMKKVCEYSRMCGADVCLGIRIRESGEVTTFLANSTGFWSSLNSQLETYYPLPVQKTDKDFDLTYSTRRNTVRDDANQSPNK
ncbi:hypothetical protein BO71DRAFT_388977 [Aspergillus ellipticus CBS 707.79]|uniref:MADS-box domain-containing protein n=1 Tax=Aspergillus ellipticus CBS 707.79 TaxID=1448320 RepID=A0A319D5J7_9EURO|nr:hypothetical protein BO71DRAFT_388977 [Aspergillus ellipticus CBS 707.79]